jgi:hypothetical protein
VNVILNLFFAYLGWAVVLSPVYRWRHPNEYATAINAFPRALLWPGDLWAFVQRRRGRTPKPGSPPPKPVSARERGLMHIRCEACHVPNDVYSPHETCYACGAPLTGRADIADAPDSGVRVY